MKNKVDLIGVGIGPSNLSTAALLEPFKDEINSLFFDFKQDFSWHPGVMFPDAKLQVSILKDLVTMIDPTSKFSFLNYLKRNNRIYIFAAQNGFNNVKRREFEKYFQWVTTQLENMRFNSEVKKIEISDNGFNVSINEDVYETKNIIMGAGLTSNIPAFAKDILGPTFFHSSQFLHKCNNYKGKVVTIIAAGQSSCEIVKYILEQPTDTLPSRINWIYKNHRPNVLEDTPFANELYTPNYSNYFFSLNKDERNKLFKQEKLTSDGVSESTLTEIYNILSEIKLSNNCEVRIYNESELTNATLKLDSYELEINNDEIIKSDIVILGTGFHYSIPKCIVDIKDEFELEEGRFVVDHNFRLIPKGNLNGNIFIHNGAKHYRGVADPNLSLLAWRSGVIINKIFQAEKYDVKNDSTVLDWFESPVLNKTKDDLGYS